MIWWSCLSISRYYLFVDRFNLQNYQNSCFLLLARLWEWVYHPIFPSPGKTVRVLYFERWGGPPRRDVWGCVWYYYVSCLRWLITECSENLLFWSFKHFLLNHLNQILTNESQSRFTQIYSVLFSIKKILKVTKNMVWNRLKKALPIMCDFQANRHWLRSLTLDSRTEHMPDG